MTPTKKKPTVFSNDGGISEWDIQLLRAVVEQIGPVNIKQLAAKLDCTTNAAHKRWKKFKDKHGIGAPAQASGGEGEGEGEDDAPKPKKTRTKRKASEANIDAKSPAAKKGGKKTEKSEEVAVKSEEAVDDHVADHDGAHIDDHEDGYVDEQHDDPIDDHDDGHVDEHNYPEGADQVKQEENLDEV